MIFAVTINPHGGGLIAFMDADGDHVQTWETLGDAQREMEGHPLAGWGILFFATDNPEAEA
jgi:hypothetical protein